MRRVALIAGLGLLALGFWLWPFVLPRPVPTGPFPIGFEATSLVIDGGRELGLELWFPAATADAGATFRLIDAELATQLSRHLGIPDTGDDTQSVARAGVPVREGRWPVVLFNHGARSFSRQNSVDFEELASHGMVVLALSHPGTSLVTRLDGGSVLLDESTGAGTLELGPLAVVLTRARVAKDQRSHDEASRALATVEPWLSFGPQLEVWERDTIEVLEALPRWPFIDPSRVVVMGHSLGATAAFRVAAAHPSRVVGVIALDGPVLPRSDGARVTVPVLALLSTQHRQQGFDLSLAGALDGHFEPGAAAWFVEIPGTSHFNFTDLNELALLRHLTPVLGPADGRVVRDHQRRALLAFIQRVTGTTPTSSAPLGVGERQR